jgi:hypothetical protein
MQGNTRYLHGNLLHRTHPFPFQLLFTPLLAALVRCLQRVNLHIFLLLPPTTRRTLAVDQLAPRIHQFPLDLTEYLETIFTTTRLRERITRYTLPRVLTKLVCSCVPIYQEGVKHQQDSYEPPSCKTIHCQDNINHEVTHFRR